jgi:hypothetical protein
MKGRPNLQLTTCATALLLLLLWCCPTAADAQTQTQSETPLNKADIINKAKNSYYGLRKLGLIQFQARVSPNWDTLFAGKDLDPEALKQIKEIKSTVVLGANDEIKVNTESGGSWPNAQLKQGVDLIFDGMSDMLKGFFPTWSLFMLTPPFPDGSEEFELKDLGNTYLIRHKERDDDISISMTKDFMITEVKVITAGYSSSVFPNFTKTDKGFVLIGYSAKYRTVKGPGSVDLSIQIGYQEVAGLKLPQKIQVHSVVDGEASDVELFLSEFQVKAR